jgi:hypothetical protein
MMTEANAAIDQESFAVMLAVYLSQSSPGSASSREAAMRHLLELTLYEYGGGLPENELGDSLGHIAGMDREFPSKLYEQSLDQELAAGKLTREDGRLHLSTERYDLIRGAHELALSDAKHFVDHVRDAVARELGRNPNPLSEPMITTAISKVVIESARRCQRGADEMAAAIAEDAPTTLFDASSALAGELTVVEETFERGNLGALIRGVRRYFGQLDDPCKRYMRGLYHKVFCHQLLNLDPAFHQAQLDALRSIRLYVDTNVAVDFLLEHAGQVSSASKEVLQACLTLGVQLFVSPVTLSELGRLRDNASRYLGSLSDPRVRAMILARPGHRTNPFVVGFVRASASNPSITLTGFCAPFKDLDQLLLGKEILVEDEASANLEGDEAFGRVWNSLRALKPNLPDHVVDHDARNFLLVQRLRDKYGGNLLLGPSVWLITRDSSLKALDRSMSSSYSIGHSRQVAQWGDVLLPLQNVLGFVASDYISYILQARFGIVPESDGVDLDFLTLLQQVDFDMDTILSLEPEHAAEVLIDLQSNRQVVDAAQQVASSDSIEQREHLRRQLSETALAAVAEERRKAVEAKDNLSSQVIVLQTALTNSESEKRSAIERVEALEDRVATYESEGFFGRLKRLFSPPPRRDRDLDGSDIEGTE